MQADPIKPMLKAPRTNPLKLKHDELLSNVAFKFNLRRYSKGGGKGGAGGEDGGATSSAEAVRAGRLDKVAAFKVGAYTHPLLSST